MGAVLRLAMAFLVALGSALAPALIEPAAAIDVTGNADVPLVEFLDIGSCADPNIGVTANGIGLFQSETAGDIAISLPVGATSDGAFVFWNGATFSDSAGDSIIDFTDPVSGTISLAADQSYGGATWEPGSFGATHFAWSYRAGVNYSGSGTYSLAGVGATPSADFDVYTNGAGMMAFYRDSALGARRIKAAHGLDLMLGPSFPTAGPGGEKLLFDFDPESQVRTADLITIVGGVFPGETSRLSFIAGSGPVTATVPATQTVANTPGATVTNNPFQSTDGLRWDTYTFQATIPANAEWIMLQVESVLSNPADPLSGPRLEWIAQTFSLPLECPNLGDQTFIDWNNNGIYDGNDEPFPTNITVSLEGNVNNYSNTDTALGGQDNGNYLFEDLPVGLNRPGESNTATYTATVPAQTGYTPTTPLEYVRSITYPGPDVLDVDYGFLPDSDISIVKLAGDAPDGTSLQLSASAVVTYTYIVTNTGLTYLAPITVTDNILGLICVEPGPLAPGASFTCQTSTLVSSSVTNIGTATGTPSDPSGTPIPPGPAPVTPPSDNDDARVVIGNARLTLTPPQDANQVNSPHLLTAFLEFDLGDGNGFVPAPAGETITFSVTSGPGSVSPTSCTTNASGQCTVTLSSSVTGLSQIQASWSGIVNGIGGPVPASATDGASKRWVDAQLVLTPPTATNEVGDPHVFTAQLRFDYGNGSGFVNAPAGETINFSKISGPGTLSPASCTTNASGQCTVTLNSSTPGTTQVSASWNGVVVTAEGSASSSAASGSAEKLWVDARINLSPLSAVNAVDDPHVITATVEQNTGSGWVSAPDGTSVSFSFSLNTASAIFVSGNPCTTTGGSCQVTINASAAGDVSVHATTTFLVSALSVTRESDGAGENSGDADKTYVAPSIQIVKTAGDAADGEIFYIAAAGPVTYTYVVTNTGDTYLVDIGVVDDNGTPGDTNDDFLVCLEAGPVAPGASFTCTAVRTLAGDRINVAVATGQPSDDQGTPLPGIDEVTDNDAAEVQLVGPNIQLTKLAGTAADGEVYVIDGPQTVQYTYIVSNTGDTYLSNIAIVDDNGTPGNLADDVTLTSAQCPGLAGPLAPGGSVTCTYSKLVSQDTSNMAVTTGTPTDDQGTPLPNVDPPSDDDDADVEVINPNISVVKTAGTALDGETYYINGPQTVQYTYVVRNTGDTYLSNITIVDDNGTPGNPGDDVTITSAQCSGLAGPLAPNGSVTCTYSKLVSQDTTNVAVATGTPTDNQGTPYPNVNPPTDDDDAVVETESPSIQIVKLAGDAPDGGVYLITGTQSVLYTYVVTNTGTTYLSNIVVRDDNGTPGNAADDFTVCTITGPLAPGASSTCTFNKVVNGDTINIATATGTPTDSQGTPLTGLSPVQDVDDAEVDLVGPSVSLTKLAGNAPDGGVFIIGGPQVVTYTYIVENSGDTYLADMVIVDDNGTPGAPGDDVTLTSAQCPGLAGPLASGGSVTCTYSKLVETDTVNIAVVTATPSDDQGDPLPGVPPVEDQDDAEVALPGAIGDFVWYDANGDGIEDVGEPGIPNVRMALYEDTDGSGSLTPGDTLVMTTTTDADGGYLFSDLPPGDYIVDVVDASNPNGPLNGLVHTLGNQSQPDPTGVISLAGGEVYKDADFGYVRETTPGNAVIGDTVWYDENGDGIQQPGEPGIPGVQVCATPEGGGAAICDVTDSNGNYLLIVPAGSYSVAPTNPPAGYTATTPVPQLVTVADGDQYLDADFGYTDDGNNLLGRIGNLVFEDTNNNGVYDAGEQPLGGVSVDLIRDENGDGIWQDGEPIIATVTSSTTVDGETGNYLFPGVPAGDYLVHVSDTNAVLFDYVKSQLGAAGLDNNNQADPYAITLAAGGENLTADFGYRKPGLRNNTGVIGNQVWVEMDKDGIFDPVDGDFGQPGITVALYRDGQLYATTTTGASGDYSFVGLPSGIYTVTVTDLFGVLTGYSVTTLGPNQGDDNNNQLQPYTVVLPENGENLTADFGYTLPGAIGDFVWEDQNSDGIQDLGEPGLVGVLVCLYNDVDGNGVFTPGVDTPVIGAGGIGTVLFSHCQLTGAGGSYQFDNLPPGDYVVAIDASNFQPGGPLEGYVATPPFQGSDPALDSNGNPVSNDAGVTLPPLTQDMTIDFGFYVPASLGDYVWDDANDDGIQDGNESGIASVLVCLFNDVNGDGSYTAGIDTPVNGAGDQAAPNDNCLLTASAGEYLFSELPAGDYIVKVMESNFLTGEPLFECTPSPRYQGIDPLIDSDGDLIAYDAPWSLVSGGSWLGVDFGYNCQPTPVQLLAGDTYARELNNLVKVHWATSNESNILGFNVLRSVFPDIRLARRLNTTMIPASGGRDDTFYRFTDRSLAADAAVYLYWIQVVEADGSTSYPVSPMKVVLTHDRTIFVPLIAQ